MSENKKIEKPTILLIEDFKNGLANLINNSNLPTFIIEPILKDFLNETRIIINRQYEAEKAQYEILLEDVDKKADKVTE